MRGKRTNGSEIDLGLAILSVLRLPGECLTQVDIAAWTDCSRQRIEQIEKQALRKIRRRLGLATKDDGLYRELMNEMFNRRGVAVPKPTTSGCY